MPRPPRNKNRHRNALLDLLKTEQERNQNWLNRAMRMTHRSLRIKKDESWTDKDDQEVKVILQEYSSLRQESMRIIVNRNQIIFWGLAALGALFGGSLALLDPSTYASLISVLFGFIVPLFCLLIMIIWVGEAMRMKRINDYVSSEIETKINKKFGKIVMSWESALKVGLFPRDRYLGASMLTLVLFLTITFLSPIFALYLLESKLVWYWTGHPAWVAIVPWSLEGLFILYLFLNRKRIVGKSEIANLPE